MANIKFFTGMDIPLELHKVRMVQKLNLQPIERRAEAVAEAGNNTFLLKNKDIFLDMLTDSGVNGMSDRQTAAMLVCDDSYAGSASFDRLEAKVHELFGTDFLLPAHQGRACENILAVAFVKPGDVVPMNFHFTTTKAHITRLGGSVAELICDEGVKTTSDEPFKGNIDLDKLRKFIADTGVEHIPFLRIEAGTNLVGGQPLSLQNMHDVCEICREHGIMTVLDASLLQDNLYFIKTREEACKDMTIREITRKVADEFDIIYFSARKFGFAPRRLHRHTRAQALRGHARAGADVRGLPHLRRHERARDGGYHRRPRRDDGRGCHKPGAHLHRLHDEGAHEARRAVVTPAGGLGCHLNAREFLPHVDDHEYPAGALAAAVYLAGGIRGMERGTLSEQREPDGTEPIAEVELLRLAMPRRVFTMSQVLYAVDRITWLFENRELVGGLRWVEEPSSLRFFFGRLEPTSDWQDKLVRKFRADFGNSL